MSEGTYSEFVEHLRKDLEAAEKACDEAALKWLELHLKKEKAAKELEDALAPAQPTETAIEFEEGEI